MVYLTFDEADPGFEEYHKPRMVVLFGRLHAYEEIAEDVSV